jgi:hypothetical protein
VLDAAIEILSVFDAMLAFPFASVNASAATETVPVPPVAPDAVKVTVLVSPDGESEESDPRMTIKSDTDKSLTSSLSVTEI